MTNHKHRSQKHYLNEQQWIYIVIVRVRSPKHKKVPLCCFYTNECGLKQLKLFFPHTLWVSSRMLLLSGDIEQNPGPFNQCTDNINRVCSSTTNTVSLLELLLELGRTAIETGGGGDCFFRSVSHQVYGTPNDHFYVRSLGIQHLTLHPELFIESNTEYSWQTYLNNMKQQGTWADGIIIQAVANALNLTINSYSSRTCRI